MTLTGGELTFNTSTLTFLAGTTVLTQCINIGLSLDKEVEMSSLLSDIFATNVTFMGETSPLKLGQLFAIDAPGKSNIGISGK